MQNFYPQQTFQSNPSLMNYQQPMQTYQQTPPPAVIPGRRIKHPAEIRPNEVPMDGGISYFPTDDMNYIYAKQWNSDGTISTAKYVRTNDAQPEQVQTPTFEHTIIERLTRIEKMISGEEVE